MGVEGGNWFPHNLPNPSQPPEQNHAVFYLLCFLEGETRERIKYKLGSSEHSYTSQIMSFKIISRLS